VTVLLGWKSVVWDKQEELDLVAKTITMPRRCDASRTELQMLTTFQRGRQQVGQIVIKHGASSSRHHMDQIGRAGFGDRQAGGDDDRVAGAGEIVLEAPGARL